MGDSTSWIAVEGVTLAQVARELPGAAGYEAATLPDGWVLAIRRLQGDGLVAEAAVRAKLSRRAVVCDQESHVMYSAAAEWRDGREVWAVIHRAERAPDDLEVRGEPPPGWHDVRNTWMRQQAGSGGDVDYIYEIPLEVARLVVDYRSDSDEAEDLELAPLATE